MGLGGTGPGMFSVLSVLGDASLDGTVDFVAVDGFVPADGEDFTFLLTGGSRSGEFSSLELGNFACPSDST